LNARQCRVVCGLRAKNEPLTTNARLRRAARTMKCEEARYADARKTRRTNKRAKGGNAGQPETTQRALQTWSRNAAAAKNCEGKCSAA
jgi:hypothetical protein